MRPTATPTSYSIHRRSPFDSYPISRASADRSSNLKICVINFRSLVNKVNEFSSFIVLHAPDIVLGCETWLNDSCSSTLFNIPDYTLYRHDRSQGRGGGTCIFVRSTLSTSIVTFDIIPHEFNLCITVSLKHNKRLLAGVIYRPPSSSTDFDDNLSLLFDKISAFDADMKIIGGDFNLPLLSWSPPSGPARYENLIASIDIAGFQQHIDFPTRNDNILDLLFSKGCSPCIISQLPPISSSDHVIVYAEFALSTVQSVKNCSPFLNFNRSAWSTIATSIRSTDWSHFFLTNDIDLCSELFVGNISRILSSHTPTSFRKQPFNGVFLNPSARRKLRSIKRKYFSTGDPFCLVLIDRVLKCAKEIHHLKTLASEFSALNGSKSDIFRLFKSRCQNSPKTVSVLRLPNQRLITSSQEIANAFNDHFSSSMIIDSDNPVTHFPNRSSSALSSITVSAQQMDLYLHKLKNSLSTGPDGIPPIALKRSGPDLPLLLSKLFNLSMINGCFPANLKSSIILPIHKRGSLSCIDNYRPINNTSPISKVFESIVRDAIHDHLSTNNLLSPAQHGFQRKRSCSSCQLDFFNHIFMHKSDGFLLAVVYFDFSKAFDKVSHNMLLAKLSAYGIERNLLSWISSFLSNRSQVVKIQGVSSIPKPITSGVIQGSVLGPLLFTVFVNDIFESVLHGKPFMYADDLKIVYHFKRSELSAYKVLINSDIDRISQFSSKWLLDLSPDKCFYLQIGNFPPLNISLNGRTMNSKKTVRDLGLIYSSSFNFAESVALNVSKARWRIGLINQNFHSVELKKTLYFSLVRPVLELYPFLYNCLRLSDKLKLESPLRYFTKCALSHSSSQSNYANRCQLLDLQPIWIRILTLSFCLLYKTIHGHSYSTLSTLSFRPLTYNARSQNLMIVTKSKTTQFRNYFTVNFPILWNSLPSNIRLSNNYYNFKKLLTLFLKSNEFQTYARRHRLSPLN